MAVKTHKTKKVLSTTDGKKTAICLAMLFYLVATQTSFALNNINSKVALTKLPAPIKSAMVEAKVKPNQISIIVQKVATHSKKGIKNKALIAHLPKKNRLPASTLKLFTTFAALDALGKDFSWQTKVYYKGNIQNGTLNGNLYIKGSGDPKLVKEHIETLLSKVQAKGITRVNGNIVLDDSLFKLKPHDASAFDGKPLRPYNAGASGLLVNFSSLVMHFTPDIPSKHAQISYEPSIADTELPSFVALSNLEGKKKRPCKKWRHELDAHFEGNNLSFNGSYNQFCNSGTWPIAHPNPKHFAKSVFKGTWLAQGGLLNGKVTYGVVPHNATLIAAQASPNLASIIKDINHYSNNVMTEQVFLSLPLYATQKNNSEKPPTTYSTAKRWYKKWWQQRFGNINNLSTPMLTKASGLCHDCYTNAITMNALLHYAAKHPHFDVFKDSLSIVGKSGTIRNYRYRMPNSPAIEKAYMKTGTLDEVTSIAGYVDAVSGQRYVVVAIINKKDAVYAKPVLDTVIDWTAKQ